MRRYAMMCSHVEAVRSLINLMPDLINQIPSIGTTRSGRPSPPKEIVRWFSSLNPHEQAKVIGRIAVINVNLGYAYESGLKLLLDIEGIEYPNSGSDGHKLPKLYSILPESIKQSICELYRNIEQTDLEFSEKFSKEARKRSFTNKSNKPTFFSDLDYYYQQKYFQQSRYKYSSTNGEQPYTILLPLRFEELIRKIIEHVIETKLYS